MSLINTAKSNANIYLSMVEKLIESAKFNKSFKAKVIDILPNGKYKVLLKNVEYPTRSEFQHSIGDSVWVCAPCNNWNELYIQGGTESNNIELLNKISELNSEIANLKNQITQTNSNLANIATASWSNTELIAKTTKNINWNDYLFLICCTGSFSNVFESSIVPTAYFDTTSSSQRIQLKTSGNTSEIDIYKVGSGSIAINNANLYTGQTLTIYGIIHK